MTLFTETTDAPANETTPYAITGGDTFEGSLGSDKDWIRLNTTVGQTYWLSVTSTSTGVSPVLWWGEMTGGNLSVNTDWATYYPSSRTLKLDSGFVADSTSSFLDIRFGWSGATYKVSLIAEQQLTTGDDTFTGSSGLDFIFGLAGHDSITGGESSDRIKGGRGNDTLHGEQGDDVLFGGEGNDLLYGGNRHDRLFGGTGDDTLRGEAGNDVVWGGEDRDYLYGEDGDDTLNGGADRDLLYGGIGNDLLNGGAGDDRLYGEGGDDTLYGGADDDSLNGGVGNDTVYGGDGNDVLWGGNGADLIYGGNGFDDARWETLTSVTIDLLDQTQNAGAALGDWLTSIERIETGGGDDVLSGNDFRNVFVSNHGDDTLSGRGGNDRLIAGNGDDLLIGGTGNDRMTGGEEADVFAFIAGDGEDVISDFDASEDSLRFATGTTVTVSNDGTDTLISYATDTITLENVVLAQADISFEFV